MNKDSFEGSTIMTGVVEIQNQEAHRYGDHDERCSKWPLHRVVRVGQLAHDDYLYGAGLSEVDFKKKVKPLKV